MATLVFAREFLTDYDDLEPTVRQKVRELPAKFDGGVHAGLHLEKLQGARDDKVRTVRVDQFWRGIVVALGEAKYALLRVMRHDEANRWAPRQRFEINAVTGIIELLDVQAVEGATEAAAPPPGTTSAPSLFDNVRDRDFTAVGVNEDFIPLLRRLTNEAELLAIAALLPKAQGDAVLLFADGKSPDEVWNSIAEDYGLTKEEVDPEDIDAALRRPAAKADFVVTTNDEELLELLSGDFEAWRIFLHPSQRSMAYREDFNGPAKVTGGAGTGKTVVAVHRARYLARRLIEGGDSTGRVLFATYTKSLADNLALALRAFCSAEEFRRIEVMTVDSFARQTLASEKVRPRAANADQLREAADSAATMSGIDSQGLDGRFLVAEWEQVVMARRLLSLADYASSPRPGRGRSLARSVRKEVWGAIERLQSELNRRGLATYLQIAERAADQLAARPARPFSHVVIDEAQDLHPAQWRLLRAAVPSGANDLFIAGDAHQRIYDHRVSLASLGIETRGRSRRLKINYRTSQQILGWALGILTGQEIDDLDGEIDEQVGYRSAFHGPAPTIQTFTTPAEEGAFVAAQVEEWVEHGVAPTSVGVVGRTRRDLEAVQTALEGSGVAWNEIGSDSKRPGVNVGTMHSSKGLEFARLAVVAANADNLPLPVAVTPEADDPAQNALDVLRERCLLYVACTRARDELLVTSSGTPSKLLPGQG